MVWVRQDIRGKGAGVRVVVWACPGGKCELSVQAGEGDKQVARRECRGREITKGHGSFHMERLIG
jgi:ADP-ribose pyrophosphatase YjhB (NUDIX family)